MRVRLVLSAAVAGLLLGAGVAHGFSWDEAKQQQALKLVRQFQATHRVPSLALGVNVDGRAVLTTSLDADGIGMDGARHDTAHSRDMRGAPGDGHDARRAPDHTHDVALGDAGTHGVPMCVERADRDRNAFLQAQSPRPFRTERAGPFAGRPIATRQPRAGAA